MNSSNEEQHKIHLQEVFCIFREAGLTLRGRKCHIGLTEVTYVGHVFSGRGMAPDQSKIHVVKEWPTPNSVGEVCRFQGLASYYRCYMHQFLIGQHHFTSWPTSASGLVGPTIVKTPSKH